MFYSNLFTVNRDENGRNEYGTNKKSDITWQTQRIGLTCVCPGKVFFSVVFVVHVNP